MVVNLKLLTKYSNSKGLTLIEVLLSITILFIILIVFFQIFGQSMLFSSKVEDKFSAANIAERILFDADKYLSKTHLNDYANKSCATPAPLKQGHYGIIGLKKDGTRYYYEVNNKKYYPVITICQKENSEDLIGLYRIKVKLYADKENKVFLSELEDYVKEKDD